MDISIEEEVTKARKKRIVIITIILLVAIGFMMYILRNSLSTEVHSNQITTGIVDRGDIENTVTASGEILPEFEQVISSPIDANIQKVLIDQGSPVNTADPILLLDKSAIETELAKQQFQLETKKKDIEKLRFELSKTYFDVRSNDEIKKLNINSLQATLEDEKRLFAAGGATKEDVAHAELNLKVANLEKKQLENAIKNKQQTMQLEIKEATIAASIQENDLNAFRHKMNLANIVATRPGVVTWVNKNIGANVKQGEVLAKVADLGSFKISGTISDTYLDKLHIGMTVISKVNDSTFKGVISAISPSIQNSSINFTVQLADRSNAAFRPNMKVELYLVTDIKKKVLRAPNGPAFKGGTTQDVFVLRSNDKAERVSVNTGLSNIDYIEVGNSLKEGDNIITSDMSEYKNVKVIHIKK